MTEADEFFSDEPVELEINGILDLHPFQPKEMIDVVESYLEACREKGLREVRIIHGKGIGVQRDRVHAWLKQCPWVVRYGLDSRSAAGWGATLVEIEVQK